MKIERVILPRGKICVWWEGDEMKKRGEKHRTEFSAYLFELLLNITFTFNYNS
jgi:hypothetical protein